MAMIEDGRGTGRRAQVDDEGRLKVAVSFDEDFAKELKKLIFEVMNEIAEGHLLDTKLGEDYEDR